MMNQKMPKIILVDHGLANNFGSHIEINRELMKSPDLYDYVLKHETGHTQKEFSLQDLRHDLNFNLKMVLKLFLFVIKNPKTWFEFLPIYKREGKLIYDLNMILLYSVGVAFLILAGFVFF